MLRDVWFCPVCIFIHYYPFRSLTPCTDTIYYTSTEYKPHSLIDVATLTGFVRFPISIVTLLRILQRHGHCPWWTLCRGFLRKLSLPYWRRGNSWMSRLPTNSGNSSTLQARRSMTASGACLLTKITTSRSMALMLICKTYVLDYMAACLSWWLTVYDYIDRWKVSGKHHGRHVLEAVCARDRGRERSGACTEMGAHWYCWCHGG